MKITNVKLGGIVNNYKNKLIDKVWNHVGIGGITDRNPLGVTGLQFQYPTNRKSIMDQIAYKELEDKLYKTSTLFTAYDVQSRELNSMNQERGWFSMGDNYGMNEKMVASILMPRSDTDTDSVIHEYDTIYASLMTRGNGDISSAIGNAISTTIFSIADNILKGPFADAGESIGTPTRNVYKGSGHREKTYTWTVSPRTVNDLIAILSIIKTFTLLSYGVSGKSNMTQDVIGQIVEIERQAWNQMRGYMGAGDLDAEYKTLMDYGSQYLTNVRVMRNPTLWYVRDFVGTQNMVSDFLGPANIIRVDVDKAPSGKFVGFAKAPSEASTMVISITFREAISHTRDTIFYPTRR